MTSTSPCLVGYEFNDAGGALGAIPFVSIGSMPSKNAPHLDDYCEVMLIPGEIEDRIMALWNQ